MQFNGVLIATTHQEFTVGSGPQWHL